MDESTANVIAAITIGVVVFFMLGFLINVGSPIAEENFVTTHMEYSCAVKWYSMCLVR